MKTQWYHILLLVVVIAIAAIFLYLVRGILPPFVIAFAAAWLLDPILDRLQKRGYPRLLAISAVYLAFLGLFVVGLVFLVPAVVRQTKQLAEDFPSYVHSVETYASDAMAAHHDTLVRLRLPTTPSELIDKYSQYLTARSVVALRGTGNWLAANAAKTLWLILIPLLSFYFLNDIDRIRERSALFVPAQWRERTIAVLSKVGAVFSSYVRGLIVVCILYAAVSTIVLTVAGVKYGIILGLISGLLYAVPFVGAILITLMIFLVALATKGLAFAALMTVVMFLLNQLAFDMVITPRVVGRSVGLHPVLSLFALMAGQQLFGLVGMVLAVPVAASIQEVIFELYPELRPKPQTRRKLSLRKKTAGTENVRKKGRGQSSK